VTWHWKRHSYRRAWEEGRSWGLRADSHPISQLPHARRWRTPMPPCHIWWVSLLPPDSPNDNTAKRAAVCSNLPVAALSLWHGRATPSMVRVDSGNVPYHRYLAVAFVAGSYLASAAQHGYAGFSMLLRILHYYAVWHHCCSTFYAALPALNSNSYAAGPVTLLNNGAYRRVHLRHLLPYLTTYQHAAPRCQRGRAGASRPPPPHLCLPSPGHAGASLSSTARCLLPCASSCHQYAARSPITARTYPWMGWATTALTTLHHAAPALLLCCQLLRRHGALTRAA